MKVVNDILMASDRGSASVLVLLDLIAAFDTIDYHILFYLLVMSFGNIMLTFTAMRTTHSLYISMKHGEAPKLPSLEACVSDIRKWTAANVQLLNLDKTEILVLGPKK